VNVNFLATKQPLGFSLFIGSTSGQGVQRSRAARTVIIIILIIQIAACLPECCNLLQQWKLC